jgi:outer membrane lipoprotein-sorting protein
MWHTLVLLALLPGQGTDDGEKLFRQMEAKMSKAKALDLSFDIAIEAGKGGMVKGTVVAMNGNKARLELVGELESKPIKMLMISDGTRMKSTGSGEEGAPRDTPKNLDEMIRAMMTRAGVLLPIFMREPVEDGQKPKEFKPDEQVRVSEFGLGKTEKLGEQEAQVVEYKLNMKPAKEPFSVTVWIDPKTSLPLKRVLAGKMEDQKMTVTETYTKLVLDGKLDEKKFELPK